MQWEDVQTTAALQAWLRRGLAAVLGEGESIKVEDVREQEQTFEYFIGHKPLHLPSSANVTHKIIFVRGNTEELVALLAMHAWGVYDAASDNATQLFASGGAIQARGCEQRPWTWYGNAVLKPEEVLMMTHQACVVVRGVPFAPDVLRKHEEGLASLLYRGHEQAEVLADHIALEAGRVTYDDKERVRRIHNARLASTLLYALYGYNSEHGTTTEQDLLLHRIGFALDPVPLDPVADARASVAATRRTAVANLMRNSVEAHYTGCPADRGGVCNCTWRVDGEVLRTWPDETTVFAAC